MNLIIDAGPPLWRCSPMCSYGSLEGTNSVYLLQYSSVFILIALLCTIKATFEIPVEIFLKKRGNVRRCGLIIVFQHVL